MKCLSTLAILAVLAAALSGCGQKGPLVRPDKHPSGAPVSTPTAP